MRLDPHFQLIEGETVTSGADIAPRSASIIDVRQSAVRDLIAGLAAEGDLYILRDASAPAPSVDTDAGQISLQTFGTTGIPKWVGHAREALSARIAPGTPGDTARWLLTFNPGSFAGVQVILSAMAGPHVLIAPALDASVADMADLAVRTNVTHISGTPTFWRAFVMALGSRPLSLKSLTLGGEASDQTLLDILRMRFPDAALRHIYATTEAGTVFSVRDGKAGFPRDWLSGDLTLTDRGTLAVRGRDTGDVIEVTDGRVLFKGRIDAMVNIGGVKVYPEMVEAHLLALPIVQEVRVSARPNPVTGHVLVADIVLKPDSDLAEAQIKAHLQTLPRAQRPVSLRFVTDIDVGATGKKSRVS